MDDVTGTGEPDGPPGALAEARQRTGTRRGCQRADSWHVTDNLAPDSLHTRQEILPKKKIGQPLFPDLFVLHSEVNIFIHVHTLLLLDHQSTLSQQFCEHGK